MTRNAAALQRRDLCHRRTGSRGRPRVLMALMPRQRDLGATAWPPIPHKGSPRCTDRPFARGKTPGQRPPALEIPPANTCGRSFRPSGVE